MLEVSGGIAKLMGVSNPITFDTGQTCPCLQDPPVPTGVLRNSSGRSGPGSQGRLSQEQSWAALSPHLDILDARDCSEHSWEFAFSIRGVLTRLCFWRSQGAMPSGLWARMRSRKREEGWDKEGQVVLSNTVLNAQPYIRVLCGTQQVSRQRVLRESVDISNGLSPWKASFSSELFLEKQICIVLSECRCIHLLLVLSLPSWQSQFAARLFYCGLPGCCVLTASLVGSILCTWHQGEPSARSLPKMFLFSKLLRTVDGCSGRGNGAEQEPWSQRKQVVPS